MNVKKMTKKDRYGNEVSMEFEVGQKALDPTKLMEKAMEAEVPPMPAPVGGEEFIMGNPSAHPGGPRGSDTVPAWLTPGEFVVNKEATDMYGPQIEAMNNHGREIQAMKKGGEAEYANMGQMINKVPEMVNKAGEEAYKQDPQKSADTLARLPDQMDMLQQWFPIIGTFLGFEKGGSVPPMPMMPDEALLHAREGFRDEVYLDSLGKPTVGYGHLLPDEYKDRVGEKPFSKDQLDSMFQDDRATAIAAARRNAAQAGVDWDSLNRRQQSALVSQAFQLGETGQSKFKNMWSAMAAGDNEGVRREAMDSRWAKQTPTRAEDLTAAFMNMGGDVPPMYLKEGGWDWSWLTGSDEDDPWAVEMPSEDSTPAPAPVPVPAMEDPYDEVPPVEPRPATEQHGDFRDDMGLAGSLMKSFGLGSDIAQVQHEERADQQASMVAEQAANNVGVAQDHANTAHEAAQVKEAEADMAIQAGHYEEYARLRKEAAALHEEAASHEADAAEKAAVAEEKAGVADDAAARMATERSDRMLAEIAQAQEAAAAAGDEEAVAKLEEQKGEITGETKAESSEEETSAASSAAASIIEETAADEKPGTEQASEVENAGAGASTEEKSKAEGFFKSLGLGSLFDSGELARAAVMYLGSRALGYSHGGSLNYALQGYVKRVDSKQAWKDKVVAEGVGKYTKASLAAFKESGDVMDLMPVGAPTEETGESKTMFVPTKGGGYKEVMARKVKVGDNTYWVDGAGNNINMNTVKTDGSTIPGTQAFEERLTREAGQYESMLKDFKEMNTYEVDGKKKYATDISAAFGGRQVAEWMAKNDVPPSMASTVLKQAYESAVADGKARGVRINDLEPYMNNAYVTAQVGNPSLFKTDAGDPSPSKTMDAKYMNELTTLLNGAGSNSTEGLAKLRTRWAELLAANPEEAEKYEKASPNTSGFFEFSKDVLNQVILSRSGG